jgi:glycosyltransferase involved in cell wall biosynthesis
MVTHTFVPQYIGGRENHVYYLSKELKKSGFEVSVFTSGPKSHMDVEDYDGIRVCRFPFSSVRLSTSNEKVPYRMTNPYNFLKELNEFSPDIVHAHDYRHFTSDLAAMYSRTSKKPLLMTLHGFFYNTGQFFRNVMSVYDKIFGQLSLKTAQRLICVSKRMALDRAISGFQSKISIVPNGVPQNMAADCHGHDDFKQKYGVRNKMILAVGRLSHQKGFEYLIEAHKKILEENDDYQLCIVGPDAGSESALRQLAGEGKSVIFTGAIPRSELLQAYGAADMFVLPSLSEGCPLTLLEAMGFGKPIVATSVGMVPDIIENGRNGVLIAPADTEYLAKGIQEVMNDETFARGIGRSAKDSSRQLWHDFITKTEDVYDEIAY